MSTGSSNGTPCEVMPPKFRLKFFKRAQSESTLSSNSLPPLRRPRVLLSRPQPQRSSLFTSRAPSPPVSEIPETLDESDEEEENNERQREEEVTISLADLLAFEVEDTSAPGPRRSQRTAYLPIDDVPQLESRLKNALDDFREAVFAWLYDHWKPGMPLPPHSQLRMHGPIARAAKTLDEVDVALKKAVEAEKKKEKKQSAAVERRQKQKEVVKVAPPPPPPKVTFVPTAGSTPVAAPQTGPDGAPIVVKRGRGRPRKHPRPEDIPKKEGETDADRDPKRKRVE